MRSSSCTAAAPHRATEDQALTLTVGIAISQHAHKTTSTHTFMHLPHVKYLSPCLHAAELLQHRACDPRAGSHTHGRHRHNPACKTRNIHTCSFASAACRFFVICECASRSWLSSDRIHLNCLGCQEASWQVSKLTCTDQQQYSHIQV